MTLRLRGEGFATAYTSVSVGDVSREMENAVRAISEFEKKRQEAGRTSPLQSHETIFVLGQADIATMIQTNNFRAIRDLRYPRAESAASAVNWVFSVPYELPDLHPPNPDQPDTLRLVLHIRLRRFAYAYEDVSERIVFRLEQLLRDAKIPARIHVGLGWSDLIVDGTFTRTTFDAMKAFVMHAHGLRLKIGEREPLPVIQRILTILGYSGDPPVFPRSTHVTFLRGIPGAHDGELVKELETYGNVYMLDGKFDFLILSDTVAPEWLAQQRVLGSEKYHGRLQKVETHLMFFPAQDLKNPPMDEPRIITVEAAELLHKDRCSCERDHETWAVVLERKIDEVGRKRKLIPRGQLSAIDNILFLLGATLRDRNICCDAYHAVEACYHGLLTIIQAISDKDARVGERCVGLGTAAIHYELREHNAELTALIKRIDEWHRFTDLLLRQRTVGSYEEILGQTDRSVVYSGGVQKTLYLADLLLRDFALRVDSSTRQIGPMATIYDSVKTALSFPSGLVRVPTRNLFTLPVAVVDLWHEAAMQLFLCRYGVEAAKRIPILSKSELLTNMADHYADLVVYLFGFHGNFDRFLASLAHGFHQIYDGVSYPVRAYAFRHTLTRIYLVYELHKVREMLRTGEPSMENLFQDDDPEPLARKLTGELASYFATHEVATRYTSFDVPATYWDLLVNSVTTDHFTNFYRVLYMEFARRDVEAVEPDLRRFETGKIESFSDDVDLNAYFAALAYFIQAPQRSRDLPYFKMMAALGSSAAIEFHRRQITKKPLHT